jgi:hypothetical protein
MRPVLIYPPLSDPTSGYHSLCYLDSYARSRGQAAATIVDANIEAFHHTYTPASYQWLTRHRGSGAGVGSPDLARAALLRAGDTSPEQVAGAVRTLQDGESFYDYPTYQHAVETVVGWMHTVGAAGLPGAFRDGFQFEAASGFNSSSVRDLTDERLLGLVNNPFAPYYEDELMPRLVAGCYDVVGINVTYESQLPFALWLARRIRRALPDAFLVAGGTEVADVWKYALDKKSVFQIFDALDALVIGEGETAYVEILDALDAGRIPGGHPNVRMHPRYGASRPLPVFHYERMAELPTPDYSTLPWHKYLSPEPFVYYSPSRGCYWNKCTFCDYGLNGDSPTSPWRQDPVDKMVADVRAISEFAKFIYFSVDVLAPATILKFAERVSESTMDFRWGAEIRLEKYWSVERCQTLRRSGCVAVSVGFESGNQRILDLIDKGTTPTRVAQTIGAMTDAGIGVQMMGFTGFPSETTEEAMDSVRFLRDHRDQWTFGGLGEFMLTAGAIVAKQPERFGLRGIAPRPGDDIARVLDYEDTAAGTPDESDQEKLDEAKASLVLGHYGRPWLGGTDTPHTYFYHDRYEMAVVHVITADPPLDDTRFVVNGSVIPRPAAAVLAAYRRAYRLGRQAASPPAGKWAFRRTDGRVYLIPDGMVPLLQLFTRPSTLADAEPVLAGLGPNATQQVWRFLVGRRLVRPE